MIRSCGFFKVLCVAADALGRQTETVELSNGADLVAGITVHHSVRADQGKAILVFVDVVDRYLPAIGVVAQLALRAILAAMQIGVAVLALVGSVSELEIVVAVAASHGGMAPLKREAGSPMIKFDPVGNHLPVRSSVAGDARQVEFAVRALRGSQGPHGFGIRGAHQQEKRHRDKDETKVFMHSSQSLNVRRRQRASTETRSARLCFALRNRASPRRHTSAVTLA